MISRTPSLGSMSTSTGIETCPYDEAIESVRLSIGRIQARNTKCASPPPASMAHLIIDETFSLLHNGALYSGMGEEAVTAAFASSLAAASEMWRRLWIWPGNVAKEQILYNHYSDKDETVLGADFSLIFVDSDDKGPPIYRVVVAQAKRLTAANPTTVDIWRKAFTAKQPQVDTVKGVAHDVESAAPIAEKNDGSDAWENLATKRLLQAYKGKVREQDLDREAENYQLTRLLHLRKQITDKGGNADFLYVMWPAKPKKTGEVNAVLYEELSDAAEDIRIRFNATTKRYPRSFSLKNPRNFRDYLLNYDKVDSMSEDQLKEVLDIIKSETAATILINTSGMALSPTIAEKLKIFDKDEYKPAPGSTTNLTLGK